MRVIAWSLALSALASSAHAQDVLVLSDGATASVEDALADAGFLVTVAPDLESAYAGDPDPADYCAVVHLNGDSYAAGMPVNGQTALQDYVDAGGGFTR
jgi:hypothetical protein